MNSIRAFWLGFIEADEMYITVLTDLELIEAYNRGRGWAQVLTPWRFR